MTTIGFTFQRMIEALESMDEGTHPVEYLYQRFYPHPKLRPCLLFIVINLAVKEFYANYW